MEDITDEVSTPTRLQMQDAAVAERMLNLYESILILALPQAQVGRIALALVGLVATIVDS